jgi:hypothetical protein
MANQPDGATQVFAEVVRFSQLDVNGFPAPGSSTITINALLKATFTPVMVTGVDLDMLNANGDLYSHFKHGDMPKYYTMALEIAHPDPVLHALLAGGTVLTDNAVALGTPTGTLAATGQITLGSLPAGTYGYRVTQYSPYGESTAIAEATGTVASGVAGAVVVGGYVLAATAIGGRIYGRSPGGEQFIANVPNIAATTTAASGTGTVTSLAVTALTKAMPLGATFTITGDTNTVKIVFTVTQAAGIGAIALAVSASQSVTTTIAAAAVIPCYVDAGTVIPNGAFPTVDGSAGPGADVGYQAPALGSVQNYNGVSMELWAKMDLSGTQTPNLPYNRWVIPYVRYLHEGARNFGPTFLENSYSGQCFENPNWGAGPFGDWQFDSTKAYQYARAGRAIMPAAGLTVVPATA